MERRMTGTGAAQRAPAESPPVIPPLIHCSSLPFFPGRQCEHPAQLDRAQLEQEDPDPDPPPAPPPPPPIAKVENCRSVLTHPHFSQGGLVLSSIRCSSSKWCPHRGQLYSYIGISAEASYSMYPAGFFGADPE